MKRRSHRPLLAALILISSVAAVGASFSLSGFTGGVTASGPNTPIAKASLNVIQDGTVVMDARTDDSGLYSLLGLAAGNYSLEITRPQFVKKVVANISVGDNETINLNASLTPSLQLSATGIDKQTATRTWRVQNLHAFPVAFTWSADPDQAGSGIAQPGYTYFTTHAASNGPDYVRLYVGGVLVRHRGGNGQDVAPTTGSLTGTVSDFADGQPLQGVTVTLQDVLAQTVATATTDSAGMYAFMDVTAGSYTVNFQKAGYYDDIGSGVTITSGVVTVFNRSMEQNLSGSISGTVRDQFGNPVVGGTIKINNLDGTLKMIPGPTDANGHYSITDLQPGIYVLDFTGSSVKGGPIYSTEHFQVTVYALTDTQLDVVLTLQQ